MSFAITDLLLNTGVFKIPAIVPLYQLHDLLRACLRKREFSCGSSPPEAGSGKKSLQEKPL